MSSCLKFFSITNQNLVVDVDGDQKNMVSVGKYNKKQHKNGELIVISSDGNTATLDGNVWWSYKFPEKISIKDTTYLSFTFNNEEEAEVNGICLDTNRNVSNKEKKCIAFGGSQNINKDNTFHKLLYTPVGETRDYNVPIGHLFTNDDIQFIALIQDNDDDTDSGLSSISNIQIYEETGDGLSYKVNGVEKVSDSFQFSYNKKDNRANFASLSDGGKTVELEGNSWKAFEIDSLQLNSRSILKFHASILESVKINAICLDEDLDLDKNKKRRCFAFGGTTNVSNSNQWYTLDYIQVGDDNTYEVPVGSYYQEEIKYIVLITKNTGIAEQYQGAAVYSDIEIYDGPATILTVLDLEIELNFEKYTKEDTSSNKITVEDNGSAASLHGNIWRAAPVDIEVNENTILTFKFNLEEESEINAICFDNNLVYKDDTKCWGFGGTENTSGKDKYWTLEQVGLGLSRIVIRPSDYIFGSFSYIVLIQDQDTDKTVGLSTFSELEILEPEPSCLATLDWDFSMDECNYEKVIEELNIIFDANCEDSENILLVDLFVFFDGSVKDGIGKICKSAFEENLSFDHVTGHGNQFNVEYFDGGTAWNYERELENADSTTNEGVLKNDASRVNTVYNKFAGETQIAWPDYRQFKDCKLRTAMCCFVADRQFNDNNGNCDENNCDDADPKDNSNLCYADFTRSEESAHVEDGYSIYGDASEGDFHCHGFAWGNNHGSDDVMKGNNLFFVSMYDHMYSRGYTQQVPGVPMCGCVENMPTVTRADCTQTDINGLAVTITYDSATMDIFAEATFDEIEFNACEGSNNNDNDLSARFAKLVEEDAATENEKRQLEKYLVGEGNCDTAIESFLNTKGLMKE